MNAKHKDIKHNEETTVGHETDIRINYLQAKLQESQLEIEQLEERLRLRTRKLSEIIDAKAKFITIIAHDLRSPFTAILGSLELLKAKINDINKDNMEYFVDLALHSSNRALNLLDNLLSWTSSQSMEKSYNPIAFNLNELVTDEIDILSDSASQKNIYLDSVVPPDLNVIADKQMIRTVIRNLINNGIKFTNRGGYVTVSARSGIQNIDITVSDNGIGISHEEQQGLFKIETFRSKAGTNKERGTGLGLIICKEFIERHGGAITIESKPGKGSRFTFSLPQCEADNQPISTQQ